MTAHRLALLAAVAPLALAAAPAWADAAADAAEVSPVVVTAPKDDAYRVERISSATKTDTPLRDVPQAVTVITDELIRDQSMQTMADIVRYVPGVTMGQGEGHRDAPTLRGNSSTADFFVDGVRDDVQYLRDVYNVERVEVLKGPNAMIFGRGGGGGVINRVIKKADGSDARSVDISLGSFGHRRLIGDLGAPLQGGFSARIVGLVEDSGSYRDHVEIERWGVTPSLGWQNADGLTVSLAYEHFSDDRAVDRGVPSFQGRPAPAPRDAFFGDPDFSRARTIVDLANLAVEYAPSDRFVVRNRTVVGAYDKYYQNSYAGGAASNVGGAPGVVALGAYATDGDRRNLFNQTDLVWKGDAMGVEHTVLTGVELGRQESDNRRLSGTYLGASSVPFASPTLRGVAIRLAPSATDANNKVKAKIAAVYVQDQIEITPQLQLLAGLRFDSVEVDFHNNRTGADFSRTDELWSPRLGLIFKPVNAASIYASYSVSHLPSSGDQFSSLDATSQALKPETFENLEVGAKWELTPELILTLAAYRLDRENTRATDPANPTRVVLTGAQRTNGFEAGLSGKLADRWEIAGGYGWQEAEITRTTTAAPAGRKVPLVPEHTVSLWNKYQVTDRLGAGLGVVHQSKMFTSIGNTVTLPGFTRLDAAVFLRVNEALRLQANVENLLDKRYFPTSHGDNNIMPGAPRSVRVRLVASF